jgi:hypothetical protein
MLGSEILDVAVGIVFVFLLVSMICSAIREGIEAWLKTRATHLEAGLRELLHDRSATGLVRKVFEHPLIAGLYSGDYDATPSSSWPTALTRGRNLPSYIPSKNFALALMDMAARGPVVDDASSHAGAAAITCDTIRGNIANIESAPVRRVLLTALDQADGDLQQAQAHIEAWYDSAMDRVSGWYKRSTQWILFAVGVVVAVGLNVNTITIAGYLYHEKAAREALVARAQAAVGDTSTPRTYAQIRAELDASNLPIGWSTGLTSRLKPGGLPTPADALVWFEAVAGWLLTAFAATLGAPFWFDLLNKIMVIRSTVKPHEKSPEEASEDRQTTTAATSGASAPAVKVVASTPAAAVPPNTRSVDRPNPPVQPDQADGCDVDIHDVTPDDELPAAEGGMVR